MKTQRVSTGNRVATATQQITFSPDKAVDSKPSMICGTEVDLPDNQTSKTKKSFNFRKLAEDSARIDAHLAAGGKIDELSGIKFIIPKGLSDIPEKR